MSKVVVILEVMWDWRSQTTAAGHTQIAPRWFTINPQNFTGRRLHSWLAEIDKEFVVTNACPELVTSAKGKGKPDKKWVSDNLKALQPFDLLVVCGSVAQATYHKADAAGARIIEMPHPAARMWNRKRLEFTHQTLRGTESGRITLINNEFTLVPHLL